MSSQNTSSSLHSDSSPIDDLAREPLRCGIVVRVREDACEISAGGHLRWVRYARQFPSPRTERVSPGHLVAVASTPDGTSVVVWRWYDAVVVEEKDELVELWEPAHGNVSARRRAAYVSSQPGSRAYVSAGLPGAEWWVAGPAVIAAPDARVDLDEIERLYTEHDLWANLV